MRIELVGIPKTVFINKIVKELINKNTEETLNMLNQVLDDGKDISNLLWEIIKYVKDILLFKSTGKTEVYNKQEIEEIKSLANEISKEELIFFICELSEIENNMKLSTQKLIILQTGFIKLCNVERIKKDENKKIESNTQSSDLEERVTKIENFLRAGNFGKGTISTLKNQEPEDNKKVEKIVQSKPKYKGKTQDYWPKLIEDFKKEGKMVMYVSLEGSIAREVNDMTLEIQWFQR